jgi:hypothetical protein
MTYGAIPKAMQSPGRGKVAVYVSDAVLPYTHQRWRMGWQIAQIGHAQALMRASEFNGQANRERPLPPGARIALQALARQIRARLGEAA